MNSTLSLLLLFVVLFFYCSCKKEIAEPVVLEKSTMTDIDNNVYQTVKIGNQWWMAENLKVRTFRNGVPLTQSQTDEEWNDTLSAYCQFQNNATSPGLLYNWFAVTDLNQLAPEGWHIPSDEEWKELEKHLGMNQSEADKKGWRGTREGEMLKIEGTKGWTQFSDVWSTNESGFTALAGGCRLFNGTWGDPGLFSTGFWWTSTPNSGGGAFYRYLDYKSKNIFRSNCHLQYGFSIRCVKN